MVISLRNRIALFFFSLLMLSAVATIVSVLLATNTSVQKQAQDKLAVGKNVFEQLMFERGNQLINAARVLVADFGFKEAVTSNDTATIASALENNRSRIDADMMVLLTLEGDVVTTNSGGTINKNVFTDLLLASRLEGGGTGIVLHDGGIYQLVMLPVKAPIPLAWSVVGKRIDQKFALQLKSLTDLEVLFHAEKESQEIVRVSTIDTQVTFIDGKNTKDGYLFLDANEQKYLALSVSLTTNNAFFIEALLSTSLSSAYKIFSPLKIQIITISTITLIFSMIMAIFIARNITMPIQYLASAAVRISSGDYKLSIQKQKGSSIEINDLSESFQSMQKGISLREEKLSTLAYLDSLTGVANRTSMVAHINHLIQSDQNLKMSIIRIYIRNFKEVNDSFGYDIGDEFLVIFTQVLSSYANSQHFVARLNTSVFCLTLENIDTNTIMNEVLHLKTILENPLLINGIRIKSHVIFGTAFYPTQGDCAEQLLRRSEIALNHAKDQSEDYAVYQEGEDERHLRKITLVNDLKFALENNLLNVFYQAKIDLSKNEVTQAEALLRWTHKDYGFVSPEEFITLAEQTGLMPTLTSWMLANVFEQIVHWQKMGIHITVAVNLSAYDLVKGFPEAIEALLIQHNITSDRVMLEITESAVMNNPDMAIQVLHQLKRLGFLLSIDDYGTGYSSLSQLKNMPIDELKIDKSFVLNLDTDSDDQAIVRSTIELSHSIGLNVVAEGVENERAFAMLKNWGCNKLQGYFISRPISAADFEVWIKEYKVPEV